MRIGRVSSRDAERSTRAIVSTNALAGSPTRFSDGGSRNGGKSSARSVRMWKVAPEQSTGEHHHALALDLCLERDAQPDLHVGRAELGATARGVELHAGERLDGAACGGDAGDGLQVSEQFGC